MIIDTTVNGPSETGTPNSVYCVINHLSQKRLTWSMHWRLEHHNPLMYRILILAITLCSIGIIAIIVYEFPLFLSSTYRTLFMNFQTFTNTTYCG